LDDEFQLIDSRRQISAWKPKTEAMGMNGEEWEALGIEKY